MIKNEKQYKITRTRLREFENSLKTCKEGKYPNPQIKKAVLGSLQVQINDFKKEVQEYEKIKNKKLPRFAIASFNDLPEVLIRSRISHGYTQKQLAKKLKMPEQQIQRYESENYQRVSFETLLRVCKELKVDLDKGTKVRVQY